LIGHESVPPLAPGDNGRRTAQVPNVSQFLNASCGLWTISGPVRDGTAT
jgi:hypothetical protein